MHGESERDTAEAAAAKNLLLVMLHPSSSPVILDAGEEKMFVSFGCPNADMTILFFPFVVAVTAQPRP